MPLEAGDKISDLNAAWPLGTDGKNEGDDHLRLIKGVMQSDSVSRDGVVNGTETELDERYLPEEFHDPTGVGSWRITNNTLECWGSLSPTGGEGSVSFPKTFAGFPRVLHAMNSQAGQASDILYSSNAWSISATGCNLSARVIDGSGNVVSTTRPIEWYAIGQWDGVD